MLDDLRKIDAVARPHPMRSAEDFRGYDAGVTITGIVEDYAIPRALLPSTVVVVTRGRDQRVIPPEEWDTTRPEPGSHVSVGVKTEGAAVPLLVSLISAAAPTVAGWIVGPAAVAAKTFAFKAVTAAISVLGALAVNALIPPASSGGTLEQDPARFSISGTSNAGNKYGHFPAVLGRHKLFMPKTHTGYTETVGDDIYWRGRLTFGYGTVALDDLKIGTTSITEFDDVEIEFRNVDQTATEAAIPGIGDIVTAWRSGADTMTLCADDATQDGYQVAHLENTAIVRETRDNTSEASIDTTFSQLVRVSGTSKQTASVDFDFEYRAVGETTWIDAGSETYSAATLTLTRRTKRIVFPSAGRYEIRITRTTAVSDDTALRDASYLTAIRSIATGTIESLPQVAEMAVRIRASDQLQGQLDQFNAVVCQMVPVWDGSSWSVPQKTRHPAWIYANALQGDHLRTPRSDAQIGLAGLKTWADDEPHWTCDYVVNGDEPLGEILDIICAAGRAKRHLRDLKYSVVRDNAQGDVSGHLTPRTSKDFRGTIAFPKQIHGFRCQVMSERAEWQIDEVVIYADGYDASNATEFETLRLPGVVLTSDDTDQGNVWKLARYFLAVHILRPETFTASVNFEHLPWQKGDKIHFVHDVPLIGIGSARVKSLIETDDYVTSLTLDERIEIGAGTPVRLTVRKPNMTSVTFGVFSGQPIIDDDETTLPPGFLVEVDAGEIAIGDLVLIEEMETDAYEVIITSIRHSGDYWAEISMVPASPAVLDADSGTIPDYDPGLTLIQSQTALGPEMPVLDHVVSDNTTMLQLPDGVTRARLAVYVQPVTTLDNAPTYFQIKWRELGSGDNWSYSEWTDAAAMRVFSAALDIGATYEVQVRSLDERGRTRGWVDCGTEIAATTDTAPDNIASIAASVIGGSVQLHWPVLSVLDLEGFEVRYSASTGATWDASREVAFVPRGSTSVTLPGRAGLYLVKTKDWAGQYADTAVSVEVAAALLVGENQLDTMDDDLSVVNGSNSSNVEWSGSTLRLYDDGGGWPATGHKDLGEVDLGAVYKVRCVADLEAYGVNLENNLDSWASLDALVAISPALTGQWGLQVQIRYASTDTGGTPDYGDWQEVSATELTGRYFEARLYYTSGAENITAAVASAEVILDSDDRTAGKNGVSAGTGGLTVTYAEAFAATPSVTVSQIGPSTGDYFEITNEDREGFDIIFKDSSDTAIAATFNWVAQGYGREIT